MQKTNCFICYKALFYNERAEEPICSNCEKLLSGLEDYFDSFYPKNEKAILVIKKINSDKNLFKRAMSYRKKGKYLPKDFIEGLIKNET